MRLPIQPKTVKPKVTTIANTIQSRFILASSLFFAVRGRAPSSPFLQWQDRRDLSSLAYTASHFLEQENPEAIILPGRERSPATSFAAHRPVMAAISSILRGETPPSE